MHTVTVSLLSRQRCQTIGFLDLKYSHGKYTFAIDKIQKTTKSGKHQPPLEYCAYPENENFCVVVCLVEHVKHTELIRENLLSYANQHEPVGSANLYRST